LRKYVCNAGFKHCSKKLTLGSPKIKFLVFVNMR
jgi:hypothetical protein